MTPRIHSANRFTLCLIMIGMLATAALRAQEPQPAATASLTLRADQPGATIHREVYGHFAEHLGGCIYGGIWVGPDSPIPNTRGIRNDVLEALKQLNVPVLRWPGGCFADEYHWMDGIGPREARPKRINTTWGGVIENNHFGTHEFMDLVEMLGAEAYVAANIGSGTVRELAEWVEYLTSDSDSDMANLRRIHGRIEPWRVRYVAVGNEAWGCGGNMRPEYYADLYRRYNTYIENLSGNRIYRVAAGGSDNNTNFTDVLMGQIGNRMDGISLHYYTIPSGNWGRKGSSTDFAEDRWFSTLRNALRMDDYIANHTAVMDRHDPRRRIGLVVDEWGTWYDPLPGTNPGFLVQQNTLRDALVAALTLHVFHKHAARVHMANLAQTVNVLQALVMTDGPRMHLTPTYHVFEMFKVHQGATYLPIELQSPDYTVGGDSIRMVSASASRDAAGRVHLSFVNSDPNRPVTVTCTLAGLTASSLTGRILTAPAINSMNTLDAPDTVQPVPFTAATLNAGTLSAPLPAKSVVILELR